MGEGILKDKVGFKGRLEVFVREKGEEEWKRIRKAENVITNTGLLEILSAIMGTYDDYATFRYFAIGTGTTTASETDTALESEQFRKQISGLYKDDANYQLRYECYIDTSEYTGDISEFGLFDASSGGNMLNRVTFTTFTKTSTMEIRFDYYLGVSRA